MPVIWSRKGRMCRMFCFEPGKEGFKDMQDVLSLNQERKDLRICRKFCFEPGKKEFKDIQDPVDPYIL
ncbi:MAG: hypothetical protein ACI35Z_12155, partial [Sphingobacterium hotanense]